VIQPDSKDEIQGTSIEKPEKAENSIDSPADHGQTRIAADSGAQQEIQQDEQVVTGRLENDGGPFAPLIKASIRAGSGISFVFVSGRIIVGDRFRLLVSPNRVIDFEVVYTYRQLGTGDEAIDGRITSDEIYPC
jgi:hypothetical protein